MSSASVVLAELLRMARAGAAAADDDIADDAEVLAFEGVAAASGSGRVLMCAVPHTPSMLNALEPMGDLLDGNGCQIRRVTIKGGTDRELKEVAFTVLFK
jgi:hypothetical protein